MAKWTYPTVRKLFEVQQGFDIIDAHYFYPDGIAAVHHARRLDVPVIITARGTDVNLIPQYRIARSQILWAARLADSVVCVSEALRARLIEIGVEAGKIQTLRNGVDPLVFSPIDRTLAREQLGISGRTVLSVGNLVKLKGHHLVIDALAELPDFRLVIVGSGRTESDLRAQVVHRGLSDRVKFVGAITQDELKYYYSACDALILASSREGMPNVILESLACGCPVVAMDVGGVPEIISDSVAGVLISERTAESIAEGIRKLFANLPSRSATHEYSTRFHWHPTNEGLLDLFRTVLDRRRLSCRPR